jgi:2-phosphosulfolactate phosphatase
MNTDVVLLPRDLQRAHLDGRLVVVFDVLRATTTMAAALAVGVREIRVFDDLDAARAAAGPADDEAGRLLCGEHNCLAPPGFDLGNSPGAFTREHHAGRVVYMSTTNGTRAIVAAREAAVVLTGALVNAGAVAQAIARRWPDLDVTLLCAGTGGAVAMEDVVGAGAVMHALNRLVAVVPASDVAVMASTLFGAVRTDLRAALAASRGGRNVVAAGLEPDIEFAARLDALDVVGVVERQGLTVRALASA